MTESVTDARLAQRNFFMRYWRGEYSLPISYWLVNWLASIAAGVAIRVFTDAVTLSEGYHPLPIFLGVVGVWTILCGVQVWQLVGLWRSAGRYLAERVGWRRIWAYLARLAVVGAVLSTCSALISIGIPQLTEVSKILFADDPSLPDYTISLSEDGREIHVSGGFKFGLTRDLRARVEFAPNAKIIVFNSLGGRIGEAESVYDLLVEKRLSTTVNETCASACALAFMGGENRWLGLNGRIGLHAADFVGMSRKDIIAAQAEFERKISKRIGVPRRFFDQAHDVKNSEMWYPSRAVLLENRVITARFSDAPSSLREFGVLAEKTLTGIRKNLPQRVDSVTELIQFDILKNVFVYTFRVDGRPGVRAALQDSRRELEDAIRQKVCQQDSIRKLILDGVIYRYHYIYAREAKPVISFDIAEC